MRIIYLLLTFFNISIFLPAIFCQPAHYTQNTKPKNPALAYPHFIMPDDMDDFVISYISYGAHPWISSLVNPHITISDYEHIIVGSFNITKTIRSVINNCLLHSKRKTDPDFKVRLNYFELIDKHFEDFKKYRKANKFFNSMAKSFKEQFFFANSDISKFDAPLAILALEHYPMFSVGLHILNMPETMFRNEPYEDKLGHWKYLMGDYKYNGPKSSDHISLNFLLYLCLTLRSMIEESKYGKLDITEKDIPKSFCPNPCQSAPCSAIMNAKPFSCQFSNYGIFMGNFKCECRIGFIWKKIFSIPEPNGFAPKEKGYCMQISSAWSFCNQNGTKSYSVDSVKNTLICKCQDAWYGKKCDELRNPCYQLSIEGYRNGLRPGNKACNTASGNKCTSILGTDQFSCLCNNLWEKDPTYKFSNCLAVKDLCRSIICQHGECISSKDGQHFFCKCSEGYYGKFCENKAGNWGEWTPWSVDEQAGYQCSCDLAQSATKFRSRKCLGVGCKGSDSKSEKYIDNSGEIQTQVTYCKNFAVCPDEIKGLYFYREFSEGSLDQELLEPLATFVNKILIFKNVLLTIVWSCFGLAVISFLVKLFN